MTEMERGRPTVQESGEARNRVVNSHRVTQNLGLRENKDLEARGMSSLGSLRLALGAACGLRPSPVVCRLQSPTQAQYQVLCLLSVT